MKIGDAEYVAKVQALLNDGTCVSHSEARRRIAQTESGHKVTQLTESECKQEIEAIVGGAKSSFEEDGKLYIYGPVETTTENFSVAPAPKRRGRPKGSRNKPKVSM